jgi:hypothetical protein
MQTPFWRLRDSFTKLQLALSGLRLEARRPRLKPEASETDAVDFQINPGNRRILPSAKTQESSLAHKTASQAKTLRTCSDSSDSRFSQKHSKESSLGPQNVVRGQNFANFAHIATFFRFSKNEKPDKLVQAL